MKKNELVRTVLKIFKQRIYNYFKKEKKEISCDNITRFFNFDYQIQNPSNMNIQSRIGWLVHRILDFTFYLNLSVMFYSLV